MASMSLVRRLISSPAGWLSKKRSGSVCRCSNRSPRSCCSARCEMLRHDPVGQRLEQVVQQVDSQHQQRDVQPAPTASLPAMKRSMATPIR